MQRGGRQLGIWLRAIRPQFYPMSLLAYTIGALAAGGPLDVLAYALGMMCMTALKIATVLTNDIYDRDSDARNRNWSPFTGGGRSLQEGGLDRPPCGRESGVALAVSALAGCGLLLVAEAPLAVLVVLIPLAVLALGYTVPPLRLSHRGLGELDVALTHGPGVVLLGLVAQGGNPLASLPWLLALVIGLAVLPAIILAGIPDRTADAATGKRTLVVRLGNDGATPGTGAALRLRRRRPIAHLLVVPARPQPCPDRGAARAVPGVAADRLSPIRCPDGRIDAPMAVPLLYIGWFVIIPAFALA